MDLDQLIAFERVVREGSFSKAAWALGVAQPTISARIQVLEAELGGRLFRRGRKVVLTERGIGMLPYVRRALATLQDGLEAIRLASDGERGRLAVGVMRSLSGSFIGPALARYCKRYPEVECYVREGDHWQMVELLADGIIEMALICWPVNDPLLADLKPVLHLREPMVLGIPKQHPLARLASITRQDLIEKADPFLLLRWWQTTPTQVAQLAARARQVADVPMDTGRFLLRQGKGAGFFTKMAILPDIEGGHAVEATLQDMPPVFRDTALVHLSRLPALSAAAKNFVGYVQAEAKAKRLLLNPKFEG